MSAGKNTDISTIPTLQALDVFSGQVVISTVSAGFQRPLNAGEQNSYTFTKPKASNLYNCSRTNIYKLCAGPLEAEAAQFHCQNTL